MKKNYHVGLIWAVPEEGRLILQNITRPRKRIFGMTTLHEGRFRNVDICCAASGIGKTNAAHALTCLIHNYDPAVVINFGIGGAYPSSGLKIGDIAVATEEVYADEGVMTKNGLETLEAIGLPLLKDGRKEYFNIYPLDKRLVKAALKAGLAASGKTISGAFATVSACTGTKKRAAEIVTKYGPICENMEGAAIAHICRMYKIPCVEIRGISNLVEDRDTSKWDIRLAAENCQRAGMEFLNILYPDSLNGLHAGKGKSR